MNDPLIDQFLLDHPGCTAEDFETFRGRHPEYEGWLSVVEMIAEGAVIRLGPGHYKKVLR